MLKADGLDEAFIGVVDVDGMPLFVDDLRYASVEDAAACEE